MLEYSTGNQTVDAMASIQLTGNIIPQIWYKQIVRDNGKPHLLAISILADITYWYRPTEIRDPGSGQFMGFKKKFAGDLLQRSYQQIADQFGESKRSVTDAIVRLENLGVLTRVFRTITVGGSVFNNVLYLQLNPDKLYEITFPPADESEREIKNPEEMAKCKADTPLPQNFGRGVTEFRERGHIISGEGSQNLGTRNTKNTTENIQEIISSSSLPQPVDITQEEDDDKLLKDSLGFGEAIKEYPSELVYEVFRVIKKEPSLQKEITAELFMRICDNIDFYAPEILNQSAYIKKCLENLIAGKQLSEAFKKDRSRGRPKEGGNNKFNDFKQNEYDFAKLEQELMANK